MKKLDAIPLSSMENMKTELVATASQKETLYTKYTSARKEAKDYEAIEQNADACCPYRRYRSRLGGTNWNKSCIMEIWKTAAYANEKPIHVLWKMTGFSHRTASKFPTATSDMAVYTFPQRVLLLLSILIGLIRKCYNKEKQKE